MSCMPAAPLSDLVTKQHPKTVLSAEFSKFALTGVLVGAIYGAVAIA